MDLRLATLKQSLSICCTMFQHWINAERFPVSHLYVNTLPASWQSVYTQMWHRKPLCIDSVLKHCAANRKRLFQRCQTYVHIYTTLAFLALLWAPYIYIYDISSLRVKCAFSLYLRNRSTVSHIRFSAVGIISKKNTVYEWPRRVHLQLSSHIDISITLKEHNKLLVLHLNAVKTNLFFFAWVDWSCHVRWRCGNKCIQACIYTSLRDACPILTKI